MTALRVAAFAIALLAVADPSITASRSSRPLVSIVGDSSRLTDRVERVLGRQFTPIRGAMPASAATVVVGDALPDETDNLSGPIVAVFPDSSAPVVRIASLDAPSVSFTNARVPVNANIAATGYRGPVTIELRAGDLLVEHRGTDISVDTATFATTFHFVPTAPGPVLLRLVVRLGLSVADSATTVVEARDDRLQVLFFDPRASWLSTFVRRVVEQDTRFAVAHRVLTSRGLSNTTGSAPPSLRDDQLLMPYSTIVVGSPEQLSEADVAGLEAFMRRRGGRVILLMDRRSAGPIDRVTGATNWRAARLPAAVDLRNEIGNAPMRAQEIAWPASMPTSASVHATSVARDSTRRGVVWSVPVGAGRLMVSGALNAWHYRDATSGFDSFWPTIVADFSAGAPRPIELSLSRRSVVPGQETRMSVWIRDAALSNSDVRTAGVSGMLVSGSDTTAIRLWPEQTPGSYSATIVGPREPGTYRVIASSGSDRGEAALIVSPEARAPAGDERHLIDAFASSRGGSVVPENDLEDLASRVSSAIQSSSRVETWHPMRSPWWIVPFALLLGAEWWWRRRRGLP